MHRHTHETLHRKLTCTNTHASPYTPQGLDHCHSTEEAFHADLTWVLNYLLLTTPQRVRTKIAERSYAVFVLQVWPIRCPSAVSPSPGPHHLFPSHPRTPFTSVQDGFCFPSYGKLPGKQAEVQCWRKLEDFVMSEWVLTDSPQPFERGRPGCPLQFSHSLRRVSRVFQLKATVVIRAQDAQDLLASHLKVSSVVIIQPPSFYITTQACQGALSGQVRILPTSAKHVFLVFPSKLSRAVILKV